MRILLLWRLFSWSLDRARRSWKIALPFYGHDGFHQCRRLIGAAMPRGAKMIRNTTMTILLAATVTAAALTQATYVLAATKFDGSWSVVVYTRSGPCDASYRFAGQIVNGAMVYGGGGIDLAGRVRPNGAASLRVSSGSAYAVASGHLTATHGSGTWYGQASGGRCSGSWVATRG
jgi:hypothetical protein